MDAYQVITDQIVKLLEQGTVPWSRPWTDGPTTRSYQGRSYRGINAILLSAIAEHKGLRGCWLTFNQTKKLGGYIKKGSRGVPVVFWKWVDELDDDGEATGRRFPFCRYYTVFSICQTVGIEDPTWNSEVENEQQPLDSIKSAEAVWENFRNRPTLTHGGDRAAYFPNDDRIVMPRMEQFKTAEHYFSTLYHEIVHAAGHPSRLNRPGVQGVTAFGSQTYSQEELVAEMGSAYLAGHAGISNDLLLENSASYIQSWIRVLKGDSKLAVIAGNQAQRAVDYVLGCGSEE